MHDSAAARGEPPPLAAHTDFRKLWWGWSISAFGSLVTRTALPWAAILTLGARPLQLGLFAALEAAPALAVGALAGVWVDRLRRRPLMIAADLARAALLGSIPLAAVLGRLTMVHLYAVAFLSGALALLFDVAHAAFLPGLVRRTELVEANGRLAASAAVAEVGAFGLAGWLVQWFSAPWALLLDALSFVASAGFLGVIRGPEPPPREPGAQAGLWREAAEGWRALRAMPVLRAALGAEVAFALSLGIGSSAYMLFVTRGLGLGTGALGLLFAFGGACSWLGARAAARAARRFGIGRALVAGLVTSGIARFATPLAHPPAGFAAALLGLQQAGDGAASLYLVNLASLVQTRTPAELRGRVGAAMRVTATLATMVGALAGGWVGERVGLRAALALGAGTAVLGGLWLAGTTSGWARTAGDSDVA